MKPSLLKITGVNSFNEEQIVNFSKLTSNGIFGIFGDTGSGKSTIIDCITLALYGKIIRYKKNRNGDFINLNRKTASVEFEFSIKEGTERKNYSIFRQFKKDKDNNTKLSIVRFIDLDNDIIISDKTTEIEKAVVDILGLNYDDFMKAVILPQGKFSEFLLLENKDKREMLERIFGLEKYGEKLKNKINEKKNLKLIKVNSLENELSKYDDITVEKIEEDEKLLKIKEEDLEIKKETFFKNLEEEKFLKNNYDLKKEYLNYELQYNEILKNKIYFDNIKKIIENSKKANNIKPYILEINKYEEEKDNLNKQYYIEEQQFKQTEENYLNIELQYKNIETIYNNDLPILREDKLKLENCIKLENEINLIQNEILNLNKNVEDSIKNQTLFKNKFDKLLLQKEAILTEIQKLEEFKQSNIIDITFKHNLENGNNKIKELEFLKSDIEKNVEEIEKNKKEILLYKQNLKSFEIEKDKLNLEIINILISTKDNLEKNTLVIEKELKEKENLIIEYKNKLNDLQNQIKIQENKEVIKKLAEQLINGEKCPICGSLEHPSPIKIIDTMVNILIEDKNNIELEIQKFEERKNELLEYKILIKKNLEDIQNKLKNFENSKIHSQIKEEYIFKVKYLFIEIQKRENEINGINLKLNSFNNNIIHLNNLILQLNEKNNEKIYKKEIIENEIKKIKEKFNIENILIEYEKLIEKEKEIHLKEKCIIDYKLKLDEYIKVENDLEKEIKQIEMNLIKYNTLLEEKKKFLNEKSNYLYNIKIHFGDEDIKIHFENISNKINEIIEKEKSLKEKYNNLYNIKLETERYLRDLGLKKELNLKEIEEKSNKLKVILEKENILKEEVLEMCLTKEEEQSRENEINEFEIKINNCKENLKRVKQEFYEINKFDLDKIDLFEIEFKINDLKQKQITLNEELEQYNKIINNFIFEIENNKKNFKLIKDLKKQLKEEIKELDILEELSKINKGGAFVEYVANSQLKHIVLDANNRLKCMSQNKYGLELIENEFIIKDYSNGGINRSSRSLSGGEIFMASLSLALALSSKIQLKNKSPLEVFFLDEGFGTLDSNTLDTVINTLEQLQINNIDVGIITHIEEIKNRISNKIIVKNNLVGAKVEFI